MLTDQQNTEAVNFDDWLEENPVFVNIFGKKLRYIPIDSAAHEGADWDLMNQIGNYILDKYKFDPATPVPEKTQKKMASDPELALLYDKLIKLCFPDVADLDLSLPKLAKRKAAMLVRIQSDANEIIKTYSEIKKMASN